MSSIIDKQRINSLTSRQLSSQSDTDVDWPVVLEMCDLIRRGRGSDFLDSIKEPIKHGAPSIQIRGLNLLEACVQNSGPAFALSLADTWAERLFHVAKATPSTQVRDKIMVMCIQWSNTYNGSHGFKYVVNRMAESKVLAAPFRTIVQQQEEQRRMQQRMTRGASMAGASRTPSNPPQAQPVPTFRDAQQQPMGGYSQQSSQAQVPRSSTRVDSSLSGLSNLEILLLEIRSDLANVQMGLERPELLDTSTVEDLKQHRTKIFSILERPNIDDTTMMALLNLNDEISDCLQCYDAIQSQSTNRFNTVPDSPDTTSSDEEASPGRRTAKKDAGMSPKARAKMTRAGSGRGGGGGDTVVVDTKTKVLLDQEKEESAMLRKEREDLRLALEELSAKYQEAKKKNKKAVETLQQVEEEKKALEQQLTAGGKAIPAPSPARAAPAAAGKRSVDPKVLEKIKNTFRTLKHTIRVVKDDAREIGKSARAFQAEASDGVVALMRTAEQERKNDSKALVWIQDLYKKEVKLRKMYYNQIQELKGNIRVYCRSRPMSATEIEAGHTDVTSFPVEDEVVIRDEKGRLKNFEFDSVFAPKDDQPRVFQDTLPLIDSVIDGFNVCIFAYGQTGSGKTHTMNGPVENRGINKRALHRLFESIAERKESEASTVHVSVMEIYNDTIFDLLVPRKVSSKTAYEIKSGGPHGMYVANMTDEEVFSAEDIESLMNRAGENRSQASTKMNEYSSRSHMLVHILVKTTNISTMVKSYGKLSLVDLAGSERLDKSGSEGQAALEAMHINKSLSALGDVIASLSTSAKHIPFRNSKLTYLLSDSMAGQAKVLMFVCISPASYNTSETLSSLNFAARARGVSLGQAKKNVVKE